MCFVELLCARNADGGGNGVGKTRRPVLRSALKINT